MSTTLWPKWKSTRFLDILHSKIKTSPITLILEWVILVGKFGGFFVVCLIFWLLCWIFLCSRYWIIPYIRYLVLRKVYDLFHLLEKFLFSKITLDISKKQKLLKNNSNISTYTPLPLHRLMLPHLYTSPEAMALWAT